MVPVGSSSINAPAGGQCLQDMAIVLRLEMPQLTPVEDIEHWSFSADDDEASVWGGLIREEDGAAGAQVLVCSIEFRLIERREVIADDEARALEVEFQEAVAIITAAVRGIEASIAGRGI